MAFYRFGEMTIDEAEIIAKDLGLKNGDPYEQVLVTTNGCRFELEDEHSLYVEKLDAKIWTDVLYGDTNNYRSNVFYWNDIYGDQIPENAIIIGDTQNNGFIVYVYSGLEKGIYYWDDSYAFDCSNKDCNAYRVADDIKSLFENLKITYRKLFARRKKCKPNIDFGKDNMLYRETGSEKIQTIDAKECKEITHKCSEFKIKFEFTRQYDIEAVVLKTIKRVEDETGYVFPKDIRNFIFDTNVINVKRTYFGVFDDIVNTSFDIIKFEDFSYERNAWDINCSGSDVEYAIEDGDFERARTLQELHKNYVVFAYCEKAANDYYAIEKSTNKIFAFNWNDLKIEKVADDFESFINGLCDEEVKRCKKAVQMTTADKTAELIGEVENSNWLDIFSGCLGKMMAIQNNAVEYVVKNKDWNIDFSRGFIALGDDEYPVQFIGSESSINNTWMWGWNNINHFAEHVISLSKALLINGQNLRLAALTTPQFDLDDVFNGHTLSIVACGLNKKDYFYYRASHDNGAVFVAVGNAPKEIFESVNDNEFVGIVQQCIGGYQVNHKIFIESFLEWNKTNYIYSEDKKTLIAHFEQDLYIDFDNTGKDCRIRNIRYKNEPVYK